MERVTMYSTTWCPDCRRAKSFLRERGVDFREVDIEEDPSGEAIVLKANDGKRTVPTVEVGTVRLPSLALRTMASPDGSSSISTSRKSTPRSRKKDFARRQSGHQVVLYMVTRSIFCWAPVR